MDLVGRLALPVTADASVRTGANSHIVTAPPVGQVVPAFRTDPRVVGYFIGGPPGSTHDLPGQFKQVGGGIVRQGCHPFPEKLRAGFNCQLISVADADRYGSRN